MMLSNVNIHASAVEAMLAGDGLPEGSTDLVTLFGCQLRALHFAFINENWVLDVHTGRSGGEPVGEKLVSIVVFSAKHSTTRGTRVVSGARRRWAEGSTYDLAHVDGIWRRGWWFVVGDEVAGVSWAARRSWRR